MHGTWYISASTVVYIFNLCSVLLERDTMDQKVLSDVIFRILLLVATIRMSNFRLALSQMVSIVTLMLVLFPIGVYRMEESGPMECL